MIKYLILILVFFALHCSNSVQVSQEPQSQKMESIPQQYTEQERKKIKNHKADSLTYSYLLSGNAKADLGNNQGAITDYTKAINLDPIYIAPYYNRGLAKYELGDVEGALLDYSKVIELNPNDVDAYINRAVLKHELDDDEGEIADYRLAIKNCKPDADIYNNLGTALYDLKRFNESADAYTEGIKHFPKDYRFYYGRGLARHQMEDRDGACEDWHKSSALGCFEANVMFPICDENYKNKHKK